MIKKFFAKNKNECQANKGMDNQNGLENQLENKWWHRLIKIIIYIIYGGRIILAKKIFIRKMLFVMGGLILLFIMSIFLLNISEKNRDKRNIEIKNAEAEKIDNIEMLAEPEYGIELAEAEDLGNFIKCDKKENSFCEDQSTNGKFIKVSIKVINLSLETIAKGGRLWTALLPWNSGKIVDNKNRKYESIDNIFGMPSQLFKESECNSELKPNLPKKCIKIYEVSADSEGLKIEMDGRPSIELGI